MQMPTRMEMRSVHDLKPYEKNARVHSPEQIRAIARSMEQMGWTAPLLIDGDNNLIAGHGRLLAAMELGLQEVPCVLVEHLTEEQRRAYILADNRLAEMSCWDEETVRGELLRLKMDGCDVTVTGWTDEYLNECDDEDYSAFRDKFKAKLTTDDCYTPQPVYDAVASYVSEHFGIDRARFCRPFYPGGDYETFPYAADSVVVDNPPFSILTNICRFYQERGIPFFLFAQSKAAFPAVDGVCSVCVGVNVAYTNGAVVTTSFLTNMEPWRVMSCPELHEAIALAQEHDGIPKGRKSYNYPDEVLTWSFVDSLSLYGIGFHASVDGTRRISRMDNQDGGSGIYGGAYLMSRRMTAERIAAEDVLNSARGGQVPLQLSEAERQIVEELSDADP